MDVKIDTKEKFSVLTPTIAEIPAIMTEKLQELLFSFQKKQVPHVILNFKHVSSVDAGVAKMIAKTQQQFYEQNQSFVICEMPATLESFFDEQGLLETMNTTPTESEAWDIVQMEEIERELMQDFDSEPC